ncbi:MAG: hypothetical protein Q8922_15950 [Bacteroidota bacterium]|nr:hypothetical protein [Bacteroidota bacterium]MDP4233178.1 hypothetical protein [Bacteroidota bacterium]MDP4242203.1 hypothetical protein [Bacteroidota bacterium]MDP4289407.1 hypothetical protein [Bacteroidota bacterium]
MKYTPRSFILATIGALAFLGAACKRTPTQPPAPDPGMTCVGHAHNGNDGGITSDYPATALWFEANNPSRAELRVTMNDGNGSTDTLHLLQGTKGWTFNTSDSRYNTHEWISVMTETADSLIVGYSNGAVWRDYYLKKIGVVMID